MSPIEDLKADSEPVDRLTELCKVMSEALMEAIELPDEADIHGIIMLNVGEQGGIQMFGYDDTVSGIADLLIHMNAMFKSAGKKFGVMTDEGFMFLDELS